MNGYNGYSDFDDFDDIYDFDEDERIDYETPPDAVIVPGPVRAKSRRGDIGREWWGQQWVGVMERFGMYGRLGRGKSYARNGSVLRLEISTGKVYAEVQGSQRRPYQTQIDLKPLTDAEWERAFEALSQQAIYAAKLLAGEMPGDIEAVFQHHKLSLFPQKKKDIRFSCSCPDWGDPCKHAAAVYYLIAEQLDANPFLLFHLRGRGRAAVVAALQGMDLDDLSQVPAEAIAPLTVEGFWDADAIALVRQRPVVPGTPIALQQVGMPPKLREDDVRQLYQEVAQEAHDWLGEDLN